MNRKIAFFDIDGTLTSEVDGSIPESAKNAIREARKISAWYMNGCYGSAKFRARCYSLESYEQAELLAEEFLETQKRHIL